MTSGATASESAAAASGSAAPPNDSGDSKPPKAPRQPSKLLAPLRTALNSDTPFAKLARSHGFGIAGDALVALALADSVFFSIDPTDARWRVGLYLLLTVAPFAVVAQFLGPLLERLSGGTRFVLIGAGFGRAVAAGVMAFYVTSFWFFPMAFTLLVLGKSHHIAKSSLVPVLINDESKLVQANSRLSIISAISSGLAAIPGGLLFLFAGAPAILAFATVVFALGGILAFAVPKVQTLSAEPGTQTDSRASAPVAASDIPVPDTSHLRRGGIRLAGSAMAYVRMVSGFLTMLLAFALRGGVDPGPTGVGVDLGHRVRRSLGLERLDLAIGGSPTWHFGAVIAATGLGGLIGAITSPHLRKRFPEKRILAGMLGLISIFGLLGALAGGLLGPMMVGFAVAFGGAVGKQSFDAILQRDAPANELGHFFARFESQFQLVWVLGALIPVVLPIPTRIGFFLLAITAGFASATYWLGRDPAPKTERARAGVKSVGTKVGGRVSDRTRSMAKTRRGDPKPPAPAAPEPSPPDQTAAQRPDQTAEHRLDQTAEHRLDQTAEHRPDRSAQHRQDQTAEHRVPPPDPASPEDRAAEPWQPAPTSRPPVRYPAPPAPAPEDEQEPDDAQTAPDQTRTLPVDPDATTVMPVIDPNAPRPE